MGRPRKKNRGQKKPAQVQLLSPSQSPIPSAPNSPISQLEPSAGVDPLEFLPPEISSIVFFLFIQPDPDYHPYDEVHPLNANLGPRRLPLTLASVSRAWRIVACSTPQLWATCWLTFGQPQFNSLWLSRTGSSRPLDIHAYTGRRSQRHSFASVPFLESLLPYANRVRSFLVCSEMFRKSDWSEGLITRDRLVFPRLEVLRSFLLTVPIVTVEAETMIPWLSDMARGTPRLRIFESWEEDGLDILESCQLSELVYVTLYRLKEYYDHRHETFLSCLPQAPKLRGILCSSSSLASRVPSTSVSHSQLRYLNLHLSIPYYLQQFSFPALECFRAVVHRQAEACAITSLFERSRCTIRALSLRCEGPQCWPVSDVAPFISILQPNIVSSSLQDLSLDFKEMPPLDIFRFIAADRNLPFLRRFLFTSNYPQEDSVLPELMSLASTLGERTREENDTLKYVAFLFRPLHLIRDYKQTRKWGIEGLMSRKLDAFANTTHGTPVYRSRSVFFGSLIEQQAFEDDWGMEMIEPWVESRNHRHFQALRTLLYGRRSSFMMVPPTTN